MKTMTSVCIYYDACYKGPLADAISNQTVDDEGDDEEQERIGFR